MTMITSNNHAGYIPRAPRSRVSILWETPPASPVALPRLESLGSAFFLYDSDIAPRGYTVWRPGKPRTARYCSHPPSSKNHHFQYVPSNTMMMMMMMMMTMMTNGNDSSSNTTHDPLPTVQSLHPPGLHLTTPLSPPPPPRQPPPHFPWRPPRPLSSSPQTPSSSRNNPCATHTRSSSSLAIAQLVHLPRQYSRRWKDRVWLSSASPRWSGILDRGVGCKGHFYEDENENERETFIIQSALEPQPRA